MVYSCLSSSTLLRSHQLVTPRTFLRYKSITAAIERGRQGGPDRSFRPRTRTDRTDERDDPVKTRREARFERFGPPRDEPEPKFGDRSTATPRSSRFGRIPRDDDAPSRFNEERRGGFGGERRSSFWGERRSSFGGERRSGLSRDSQGGFGRERQNDFGRERRGTDFEQRPESTTDPKVASQTRVYKRKPLSPDALDNKGNLIAETGASGVADRSPTRREAFSERGEQGRPRRLTNDRNDSRRQGTWRDDSAPSYTPRPRGARDEGVRESRFSPRSSATRDDDATSYIPRSRDTDDRSFEPRFSHRPDSKGARRERHGRESSDVGSGTRGEVEAQKTFVRGPESLPYTTAASEFIYGHMSVVAAMKANRRKFYNLYVHSRGASRDGLMSRIRAHKLFPITHEVGDEYMRALDKASSGRPHNGVILEASPLPVPPITELKTASIEDESFSVGLDSQSAEDVIVNGKQELYSYKSGGWRHPLILYVDGVVDEGNLGAIARSAYVLGADAIITPTHHTANWSHIAVKASAGAAEAIPLFKVGDPTDFLKKSAGAGWCIYASDAVPPAPSNVSSEVEAPEAGANKVVYTITQGRKRLSVDHSPVAEHPTILMMGAEGTGLRTSLVNLARYKVGIPHGREVNEVGVDSLNVSVAASILCYEMLQKPRIQPERDPENVVF